MYVLSFKKVNLTSTFRRIGEEIYKSFYKNDYYNDNSNTKQILAVNLAEDCNSLNLNEHDYEIKETEKSNSNAGMNSQFLQSDLPQIRILSCLIILRTLNQGILILASKKRIIIS